MASRPVIFLSDFGDSDEFAGVCRAVIERYAPGTPLIDLAHRIPAGDVRRGALALEAAAAYAPAAAIWLAVVDPGVGTRRRALALRVGEGYFVGPDNGLLSLAASSLGEITVAVDVSRTSVRLQPTSHTFHGRDVFAPVAAALARGGKIEGLGEQIDPGSVKSLELPRPQVAVGSLTAHVLYADTFGNLILDAGAADLESASLDAATELAIRAGGRSHRARLGSTFADAGQGLIVYGDSSGRLGLAFAGRSAAEALDIDSDIDGELVIEAWA